MLEMYVGSLYNKKIYIADPAKLPITGGKGVGNLCYAKRQLLSLKE